MDLCTDKSCWKFWSMAHQSGQSHTHTKSTNILRKNPLPISLFIQYSFQIQFPPACEYNRFSKKLGETAVSGKLVRDWVPWEGKMMKWVTKLDVEKKEMERKRARKKD